MINRRNYVKSENNLYVILAFIFTSGKITKFTIGEIQINDNSKLIEIKKDFLKKLEKQLKGNKLLTLKNQYGNEQIQVVTKNLNAINLYIDNNIQKQNKKEEDIANKQDNSEKICYGFIFQSGKVIKFTKFLENGNKLDDLFNGEVDRLINCKENNDIFLVENNKQDDYLFIMSNFLDSVSIGNL